MSSAVESRDSKPVLRVLKATKRFGATLALDGVSLEVHPGQVLAVIGENGAGKSTLVKIISGITRPDTGEVSIMGQPVAPRHPKDAMGHGIATAYQELSLMPDLTVAENLFLPRIPTGRGHFVNRRAVFAQAESELRALGIESIDVHAEVRSIPLDQKQKLEIAKAIIRHPKVLLLDEPTSALNEEDVEWLFGLVGRLRDEGAAIVYISHKMAEIKRLCDRLVILRNGHDVGDYGINELADSEIIRLMIGRSQEAFFPTRREQPQFGDDALAIDNLSVRGKLFDVSLAVRTGEILGVAGLAGHGQRELFMAAFGLARPSDGHISVHGKKVRIRSPHAAVSKRIGIALVPEDRKTEGLFLNMSTRENMSLPVLSRFGKLGWLSVRSEKRAVLHGMAKMDVRESAMDSLVTSLSGGNQQKVVLGKWIMTGAQIMLLYDPTRGVDVGTKSEIYRLIRAFTDAGGAVLLYSSELPELVNLSDRIVVFREGRIARQLEGEKMSTEACMAAAVGHQDVAEATVAS